MGKAASRAEREHLSQVAALGCIACIIDGYEDTPCEIHHIREGMGMAQRNDHFMTIGLCTPHHRTGEGGVPSIHGQPAAFIARYGTERELLDMVRARI